jgi:beta-glucosidase
MEGSATARTPQFPAVFRWGAAISAYQVEGAVDADGRGVSIWDRFVSSSGRIANGDTGVVACDFYRRYRDDVRLMDELGLNAFRFSIAWPRVIPDGRGRVNEAGLDFYDRLVDELLEHGIEPFPTLYHWDLPQALEDRGGWPVRDTVEAFVDYAAVVVERLGDRVRHWITQNEPWVVSWLGYGLGEHAPGRRSRRDALAAAHHVLLSHGRAVEVLRAVVPNAEVGIAIDPIPMHPETESEADVDAARLEDGLRNRWFLDPVLRGRYPDDVVAMVEQDLPAIEDWDLATISAPIDFLGVNYYRRHIVRAGEDGTPVTFDARTAERTDMGWEVYPEGLTELLVRLRDEYGPPAMYVTENGASFEDARMNGAVEDARRVAYLERHVQALADALERGVPLAGYFVWSLLDNFEWTRGYAQRFGLVYVDFETLERVPKSSYRWYRDLIASQQQSRTA